jgi:hypothetical protein
MKCEIVVRPPAGKSRKETTQRRVFINGHEVPNVVNIQIDSGVNKTTDVALYLSGVDVKADFPDAL